MFLLVHSGRGLVVDRKPNLKLFNILYWLSLSAFCVLSWLKYLPKTGGYEYLWSMISIVSLDIIVLELMEIKKKNYVAGQCLNQFGLLDIHFWTLYSNKAHYCLSWMFSRNVWGHEKFQNKWILCEKTRNLDRKIIL